MRILSPPVIPSEAEGFAESFGAVEGPLLPLCSEPSGTIQMCGVFLFAAKSTSTALNSTHLPSGEGTGSPTRFSFIMSSKVKGCLVWEKAGTTRQSISRNERRRMHDLRKEDSIV